MLIPAYALKAGNDVLVMGLLGVLPAILVTLDGRTGGMSTRAQIAFALGASAQAMLLTAAGMGHPLQADAHFAFFITLAVIGVMSGPVALLAAAVFIAVHHMSFNFLLP